MHPIYVWQSFTIALGILLVAGSSNASYDPTLDEEELDFLQRINDYRTEQGAPCLTPSPTMNAAADYMSRFMGEEGFFDHNEPPCDEAGDICTGRDPFDRIEDFGHTDWTTSAENIAAGNPDGEATFEQWRNSPGHDRNMRNPDFTSIGIARVEVPDSYYRYYWTTNFSNFIDGNGDCTRDDPSDYASGSDDSSSGGTTSGGTSSGGGSSDDGGCAGAPLVSPWLLVAWGLLRRRRT